MEKKRICRTSGKSSKQTFWSYKAVNMFKINGLLKAFYTIRYINRKEEQKALYKASPFPSMNAEHLIVCYFR